MINSTNETNRTSETTPWYSFRGAYNTLACAVGAIRNWGTRLTSGPASPVQNAGLVPGSHIHSNESQPPMPDLEPLEDIARKFALPEGFEKLVDKIKPANFISWLPEIKLIVEDKANKEFPDIGVLRIDFDGIGEFLRKPKLGESMHMSNWNITLKNGVQYLVECTIAIDKNTPKPLELYYTKTGVSSLVTCLTPIYIDVREAEYSCVRPIGNPLEYLKGTFPTGEYIIKKIFNGQYEIYGEHDNNLIATCEINERSDGLAYIALKGAGEPQESSPSAISVRTSGPNKRRNGPEYIQNYIDNLRSWKGTVNIQNSQDKLEYTLPKAVVPASLISEFTFFDSSDTNTISVYYEGSCVAELHYKAVSSTDSSVSYKVFGSPQPGAVVLI